MPRRVLAAVAAFSFALVWSTPAYADSTVTLTALPGQADPEGIIEWGCPGPFDPATASQFFLAATDQNPAPIDGDGSWGIDFEDTSTVALGPGAAVSDAASLGTMSVQAFGVTAGRAMVFATPASTPSGEFWVGTTNVSGTATANTGWDAFSAPGASTSFSWQLYDGAAAPWTPVGPAEAGTLAQFETAHGASVGGYFAGFIFGCGLGPQQRYFYDDLALGASGAVTTYNFDKLSMRMTMGAAPGPLTAGRSVTIRGTSPDANQVRLQQKPYGSSTWSTVATVSGSTGAPPFAFAHAVAPTRQTSYRWEFPAGSCCVESFSGIATVKVYTAVTIKLADSTIRKGQRLVVSGVTKPHKGGARVTLWRRTAEAANRIATSTVHADGTYKISYRVPSKGRWKVYVTVGAASGNLPGTSAARTATVS